MQSILQVKDKYKWAIKNYGIGEKGFISQWGTPFLSAQASLGELGAIKRKIERHSGIQPKTTGGYTYTFTTVKKGFLYEGTPFNVV